MGLLLWEAPPQRFSWQRTAFTLLVPVTNQSLSESQPEGNEGTATTREIRPPSAGPQQRSRASPAMPRAPRNPVPIQFRIGRPQPPPHLASRQRGMPQDLELQPYSEALQPRSRDHIAGATHMEDSRTPAHHHADPQGQAQSQCASEGTPGRGPNGNRPTSPACAAGRRSRG